jgi:hypothetical protein
MAKETYSGVFTIYIAIGRHGSGKVKISELLNLDRKSESDRERSQALASINAATFAFELIS